MSTHKPIKWARVAKVAGAVVAGVLAAAAGAIPAWNWHVAIRPQPPRDGSHEEDGEDQDRAVRSPDRRKIVGPLAALPRCQSRLLQVCGAGW